jgi:hypothetical protein
LPRFTASLGLGYKYRGSSLKIFEADDNVLNVNMDAISGFSISPEVRYYIQSCEDALPSGFYGGIYFRYTRYETKVNFDFYPENAPYEQIGSDFKLNEFGVGFQLGYQLPIKKRFVIDFQFFGPRYSFVTLFGDFNTDVSDEFKAALEDYANEVIDRLGNDYNLTIEETDEQSIKARFNIPSVRFGIGLGYAF